MTPGMLVFYRAALRRDIRPPVVARCLYRGCDQYAKGYCATHRFERFRDEDGWIS